MGVPTGNRLRPRQVRVKWLRTAVPGRSRGVVTLAIALLIPVSAEAADPFGCLASGLCPPAGGPLPAGTSGLLFVALGLVLAGVAIARDRARRG
jgi:hypothetical protein